MKFKSILFYSFYSLFFLQTSSTQAGWVWEVDAGLILHGCALRVQDEEWVLERWPSLTRPFSVSLQTNPDLDPHSDSGEDDSNNVVAWPPLSYPIPGILKKTSEVLPGLIIRVNGAFVMADSSLKVNGTLQIETRNSTILNSSSVQASEKLKVHSRFSLFQAPLSSSGILIESVTDQPSFRLHHFFYDQDLDGLKKSPAFNLDHPSREFLNIIESAYQENSGFTDYRLETFFIDLPSFENDLDWGGLILDFLNTSEVSSAQKRWIQRAIEGTELAHFPQDLERVMLDYFLPEAEEAIRTEQELRSQAVIRGAVSEKVHKGKGNKKKQRKEKKKQAASVVASSLSEGELQEKIHRKARELLLKHTEGLRMRYRSVFKVLSAIQKEFNPNKVPASDFSFEINQRGSHIHYHLPRGGFTLVRPHGRKDPFVSLKQMEYIIQLLIQSYDQSL